MYILENRRLRISILDPVADLKFMGSRYCTGGYIWQVSDTITGNELLSGPRFPAESPPQFDGQGAPEAFMIPLGDDPGTAGSNVTVIGVGSVVRAIDRIPFSARENPGVETFCIWDVRENNNCIEMKTVQKNGTYGCNLLRSVVLEDADVISKTLLMNISEEDLRIRWFPHPFFPLNHDLVCGSFSIPWELPENPAYFVDTDGCLCMKKEYSWPKGLFQKLNISGGKPFSAEMRHPHCSGITVTCDYPLADLPFWANENTFSPEPYLATVIAPGTTYQWSIRYRFGE